MMPICQEATVLTGPLGFAYLVPMLSAVTNLASGFFVGQTYSATGSDADIGHEIPQACLPTVSWHSSY